MEQKKGIWKNKKQKRRAALEGLYPRSILYRPATVSFLSVTKRSISGLQNDDVMTPTIRQKKYANRAPLPYTLDAKLQRYLFCFFPGKVYFLTFLGKNCVSEWKVFFFFPGLYFFFRPLRKSEWVGSKLLEGKKNTNFCWKKKYTAKL